MRAAIGLVLVLIPVAYLGPRIGILVDLVPVTMLPEALWSLLAMDRLGVPVIVPAAMSFFGGLMIFASAHPRTPKHTHRRHRRPTR